MQAAGSADQARRLGTPHGLHDLLPRSPRRGFLDGLVAGALRDASGSAGGRRGLIGVNATLYSSSNGGSAANDFLASSLFMTPEVVQNVVGGTLLTSGEFPCNAVATSEEDSSSCHAWAVLTDHCLCGSPGDHACQSPCSTGFTCDAGAPAAASCDIDSTCVSGWDANQHAVVQLTHPILGNFCTGERRAPGRAPLPVWSAEWRHSSAGTVAMRAIPLMQTIRCTDRHAAAITQARLSAATMALSTSSLPVTACWVRVTAVAAAVGW